VAVPKVQKWQVYESVWALDGLQASDRLLLLALAKFWVAGKPVSVGQDVLARLMCCNRATVQRSLKRLGELNMISWVSGSNYKSKVSEYFVPVFDSLAVLQNATDSVAISSSIVLQNASLKYKENKYIYIKDSEKVSLFSTSSDSECFRVSVRYVMQFVKVGASSHLLDVMRRFEGHNVYRLASTREQVLHNWWLWLGREFQGYSSSVEGSQGVQVTEGKE